MVAGLHSASELGYGTVKLRSGHVAEFMGCWGNHAVDGSKMVHVYYLRSARGSMRAWQGE